jgi:hypothetical protein
MDFTYILGVGLAILSGILNQMGNLLQKKAVNDIPPEAREKRLMRTLIRNPTWIVGLFLAMGAGTAAFMVAVGLIGPALVPGLMASGLIVLAIGSVKLIGEKLSAVEYVGIFLMILGIALLGLSKLDVGAEVVRNRLALPGMVARITIFTMGLFMLWGLTHLAALKSPRRKGIVMGFSNGFPFSLSNFWISPLVAVGITVMSGKGSWGEIGLFVLASAILVGTNAFGIQQTQVAFKFGQASIVIPIQQIPVQTTPILVYFYVFSLEAPARSSAVLILCGALLIIVSGFVLARRQSELESIH